MKKTAWLPFLLLFWMSFPLYAVRVPGLYQAEVAVADQQPDNREQGVATAMREVLIKLTGDRFAPERTSLQPVIDKADDYIQQYRYVQEPAGGNVDENGGQTLRLHVQFDEQTLNQTLRDLGIPVWGRERPSTLVWLAVQDQNGRHLAGMEEAPDFVRELDRRAAQRGVVLIFPLMDLTDTGNLKVSDIWGGFSKPVLDASSRYQADTVLTGKISEPAPGIWEARWTAYLNNGESSTWTADGEMADNVLDEGVDGLADLLASHFVQASGGVETTQISLRVQDVNTADQYARVLQYLQSLSPVSDVEVSSVRPGEVRFSVTAHGGEAALQQTITLGHVMAAVEGGGTEDYRLLP